MLSTTHEKFLFSPFEKAPLHFCHCPIPHEFPQLTGVISGCTLPSHAPPSSPAPRCRHGAVGTWGDPMRAGTAALLQDTRPARPRALSGPGSLCHAHPRCKPNALHSNTKMSSIGAKRSSLHVCINSASAAEPNQPAQAALPVWSSHLGKNVTLSENFSLELQFNCLIPTASSFLAN